MDDTALATTRPMPTTKPYKPIQAHGTRYAVVKVGPFFEVRRREYERGKVTEDQLLAALPTEQDADDMARAMAEIGG